ncbi:MAG: hypothetical protein WAN05_22160, partial [Roseiarcus sp.]
MSEAIIDKRGLTEKTVGRWSGTAPSDCIRVFGVQGSKRDPATVHQDPLTLSMTFERLRLEPVSKNPE